MGTKMKCVISLTLALLTGSALAAEIPHYEIEATCHRFGTFMSGNQAGAQRVSDQCMADEQDAYDLMKFQWSDITEAEQQKCLSIRNGRYVSMQYCVGAWYDYEMTLKHNAASRRFRY